MDAQVLIARTKKQVDSVIGDAYSSTVSEANVKARITKYMLEAYVLGLEIAIGIHNTYVGSPTPMGDEMIANKHELLKAIKDATT
jgi:hypothetical protein